jgi:hypothetical protein
MHPTDKAMSTPAARAGTGLSHTGPPADRQPAERETFTIALLWDA